MATKIIAVVFLGCSSLGGFLFGLFPISHDKVAVLSNDIVQEPAAKSGESAIAGDATPLANSAAMNSQKSYAASSSSSWKSKTTLGVHVGKVDEALRKHLQIPQGTGLLVEHVVAGSGAEKSKLKRFDVLYQFDDQILVNAEQLSVLIELRKPGTKVKLTIMRDGKSMEVESVLQKKNVARILNHFDAFYFFHGHAGRTEFQNCSVCHVSPHSGVEDLNAIGGDNYDNYKYFHGAAGKKEFQNCSNCHAQVVHPLNISESR